MTDRAHDLANDFVDRPGAALVVGGSGGIGSAVVAELARRGSDVAFTFHANHVGAEELAEHVSSLGRQSWTVELDLADGDLAAASVDAVAQATGGIHTVIYAAGPHVPQQHLSTVSPAEVRAQLDTDAAGFFAIVSGAISHLRESHGSIVAITTAATQRFPVRDGLSSIPKAAVEAVVRGFAAEEGRFGVRANSVGPGMLTVGMAERLIASGDLDDDALESALSNIPLRRFGQAADIVEAVCFLASERAAFITGQHLSVDGGFTI